MESQPNGVFLSHKSQNEVAFCLAVKNGVTPLDRDDSSKVVIVKNGYGAAAIAFTVWATEDGSRVEYRKSFGLVGAKWKQCL